MSSTTWTISISTLQTKHYFCCSESKHGIHRAHPWERLTLVKTRVCALPVKMYSKEASCITVKWELSRMMVAPVLIVYLVNTVMGALVLPINSALFLLLLSVSSCYAIFPRSKIAQFITHRATHVILNTTAHTTRFLLVIIIQTMW